MRDYILSILRNERPDLDLREGSPIVTNLVDPLSVFLPLLNEKLSNKYNLSLDEKGELYLVERDEGETASINIKLFFSSPDDLEFGAYQMTFTDDNGNEFTNPAAVSLSSNDIELYVDDGYYYASILVEGQTVYNEGTSLSWDNPTSNFSFLSVSSINSTGSYPETNAELDTRIANEVSARNMVTEPGITAFLNEKYGSNIRDVLSVGFGHDKMNRDLNEDVNFHTGGYMDLYVKTGLPVSSTLKADLLPLEDTVFEESVGLIFAETDSGSNPIGDLIYKNLVSASDFTITAESLAFAGATYTEGAVADFTVDRTSGVITLVSPGTPSIIADDLDAASWKTGNVGAGNLREVTTGTTFTSDHLDSDMLVYLDDGTNSYWRMVISVDSTDTFTISEDIPVSASTYDIWRFEPVEFTFQYNPLGVKLENFTNPLMWIDKIEELDPATDEPYDPTVEFNRYGGYGTGTYGGYGYGFGDDEGWVLKPTDENYRYSSLETGVLEFIGSFTAARIQIEYRYAPQIIDIQSDADTYRTRGTDVLVKAFIPTTVNIDVDVTGDTGVTEVTGLNSYIWELYDRMELSDVIDRLYELGVTFVDLGDLINNTTFEKWKIDGTFTTTTADDTGVVDIDDNTSRLLPGSINIEVS